VEGPRFRYLPAPLWAVLVLPFGLTVGYAQIAVPYTLRMRGLSMATIGAISAISQTPHAIKFLWAPALDSGWKRKSWFYWMVAATAAALALTALIPPSQTEHFGPFTLLQVYTAVLTIAAAAVSTSSSAVLALMATTLPNDVKGRASGWQTAGNLVGTNIGGALVTWFLAHLVPRLTGLLLALMCGVCVIPAFFIDEAPLQKHALRRLLLDLLQDVWRTLKSRDGWTGMIICLSPVGTGALINLFSALARDYAPDDATREHMVVVVNGIFGGLIAGAGALVGGYVCDRMNRRFAYVLFGGVTALSAIGILLGPATPMAFTVGCLAYSFANGLCYAAFYAFVLEMIGEGAGVTTKLALFVGASNLAINYVTWLDGVGYDWAESMWKGHASAGRVGMCGMDALSSFVGIAVLVAMMVFVRRWDARAPQPQPA
jgi:PAT family beta-lactamase induction signal transducer AmpG